MDVSVSRAASYMTPYFKNLLVLCVVTGSTSLVCIVLNSDLQSFINYRFNWLQHDSANSVFYSEGAIREMALLPPSKKACYNHSLLASNATHIWVVKDNFKFHNLKSSVNISCCYKSFYRPRLVDGKSSHDNRVKYSVCRMFTDSIEVTDEFVRVRCSFRSKTFDYFFLFAREKQVYINADLPYNILILGMDSVSRLNFHRTMRKTAALLSKLGAVELLRYNKVGDNTFPNFIPLLLGKHAGELPKTCWPNSQKTFDNCFFLWDRFGKAGFATAYAEDAAMISTFNYKKRGFAGFPTHYYLYTFFYEAERFAKKSRGYNKRYCINDDYVFKVILNYVEDLTALSTLKLFGIFWENTISHNNLNYPELMDDAYTELFEKMHNSGYLNKTIIFLISDHGMRLGQFRKTRQGFLEDRLPVFFALMPPSFREKFSEAYNNLKHNAHRLNTPFDVHATLSDLVDLDTIENAQIFARTNESYWKNRSISLFLPIPDNRTCKIADIDAQWCVDFGNEKIDSNNPISKEGIKQAVSHLNNYLKTYPQCAKLDLDKVFDVTLLVSGDTYKNKIKKSVALTVTFRTNPGGGEFEATLGRQAGHINSWILLGSISRLNLYGNQSYCIEDNAEAKLYCYCN